MQRAMSPTARPVADAEELRRAMSPPGTRPNAGSKPMNGIAPGASYPNAVNSKGKGSLRSRGDEMYTGSDEGADTTGETGVRERALSPDATRSKSPTGQDPSGVLARSMSPQQMQDETYQNGIVGGSQQPINMASLAMQRNAQRTRTPSPIVDRTRPADSYNQTGRSSPTVVNGYNPGHTPRPGSTGNVTADLIRDLKLKEAEVDELKKREAWMRAALRSATNAGFTHSGGELDLGDDSERRSPGSEETDVKGFANVIVRLKQEQARVQVCPSHLCLQITITQRPVSRTSWLIKFVMPRIAARKWSEYRTPRSRKRRSIAPK